MKYLIIILFILSCQNQTTVEPEDTEPREWFKQQTSEITFLLPHSNGVQTVYTNQSNDKKYIFWSATNVNNVNGVNVKSYFFILRFEESI